MGFSLLTILGTRTASLWSAAKGMASRQGLFGRADARGRSSLGKRVLLPTAMISSKEVQNYPFKIAASSRSPSARRIAPRRSRVVGLRDCYQKCRVWTYCRSAFRISR